MIQDLIDDISSWAELERKIASLPTEIQRGKAFEEFCKAFFALDPVFQFKTVCRQNEVPASIRRQLGCPGIQDIGIDGIAITIDGKITAYQAKFRSDRNNIPTLRELGTFFTVSDKADWRIVISNANNLPSAINDRINQSRVLADRLDHLKPDFFDRLRLYLKAQCIKSSEKRSPHETQQEAIDAALAHFINNDRGQLILPCGTGKTRTAMWIAEKIGGSHILVLVPSLALMSQTLREWAENTSIRPFSYLCLCSDTSVDLGNDSPIEHIYEMDVPVTTDVRVVSEFLAHKPFSTSILFSTYQSSKMLSEAVLKTAITFDIAIFDEAHRTTGTNIGGWSLAIDNKKVPIKKRLFMTATPRIYAPHIVKKPKDEDMLICSMDNSEVYGNPFYEMTFGAAIERGHITDYKIVVICVTNSEVNEIINRGGKVITDDEHEWDAKAFAKRVALVKGMNAYGMKKVFTFHGRVRNAKAFTDITTPYGIYWVFKMLNSERSNQQSMKFLHVNGTMSSGVRNSLIGEFKEAEVGIMSNARCLTEGVDVPAVDTVAFIDPKKSLIDIVQATGRAMRKANWKEKGYIFIPVVVEEGVDPEKFIENSDFNIVWQVLQSMADQDQRLESIVSNLRVMQGKGEEGTQAWNDAMAEYVDKIEFYNLPSSIDKTRFINSIYTKTVEVVGRKWDFWYGLTLKHKEQFGTANALRSYITHKGFQLGQWQGHQRKYFKQGTLLPDRVLKLNSLGFSWSVFDDAFEKGFQKTVKYKKQSGDANTALRYKTRDGYRLGQWQSVKRIAYKKGKLSADKIQRLEAIGFIWDHLEDQFEQGLQEFHKYKKHSGSPIVPKGHTTPEGFPLGSWQGTQRQLYRTRKLPPDRIKKLEEEGFVWNAFEDAFARGLRETIKYKNQFGTSNATCDYRTSDGFKLGPWQQTQRYKYKHSKLSLDKIQRLERIGVVWDILDDIFEQGLQETVRYKDQFGTPNAHQHYKTPEGFPLGQWQSSRRQDYRINKLDSDRIQRLDAIGFVWNLLDDKFEKGFSETVKYRDLNGNANAFTHCITLKGFKLGTWQSQKRQAYKKGKLSADKINRLQSIGFSWNFTSDDFFDVGFQETTKHKELFDTADAHLSYKSPAGFALGRWQGMLRQSYKKGQIGSDKIQLMASIGFTWDTFERGIQETKKYIELRGTPNAPVSYKTPEGYNLGSWQSVLRKELRKGNIVAERVRQLRELGFKW